MNKQLSSPGPANLESIGSRPTGAQNQGNNIDVTNYAKVNTGKAAGTTIDSPFTCDLVKKIPSGQKDGGL